MTTTADRKKAASEALLEPETYESQPIGRLVAERVTIGNRLSGLSTQLKRAQLMRELEGAGKHRTRVRELERRQRDLLARRKKLNAAIEKARVRENEAAAATDVVAALNGRAGEAATT